MSKPDAGKSIETGRLGLGPIDQTAYVVANIEASLPVYEALYGPFTVGETPMSGVRFRGKEIECNLKLAVNNAGPIEIELIEVLEGETPHSEYLRKHGEGLHHVRFRITDLDAKIEALEAEGYHSVFYKRFGPSVAFAYLEAPDAIGKSLIELLEMPRA